jgi:uncharacterized protein YndB with AHSA1/START domain
MQNRSAAIYVGAGAARVWQALTDPYLVRQLFGVEVESDWQPGSPITFRGPGPVVLRGQVVHAEPPRLLAYSLSPGSEEDGPQEWLTWGLVECGSRICRVSICHDDLDQRPDPEQDEAILRLLSDLKSVVERSRGAS